MCLDLLEGRTVAGSDPENKGHESTHKQNIKIDNSHPLQVFQQLPSKNKEEKETKNY